MPAQAWWLWYDFFFHALKLKCLWHQTAETFQTFFSFANEKIPDKRMKNLLNSSLKGISFRSESKWNKTFIHPYIYRAIKEVKEISLKWKAWITFLISIHSFFIHSVYSRLWKWFNMIAEVLSMNFAGWNSHSYHFV